MDDDALAHAWESFATALREVPAKRMERYLMARMMRGVSAQEIASMQYQQAAMNRAYDRGQYRGIQRGIFGFGITI